MTTLEKETLADGFRICLLGVHADARQNRYAYRYTVFDGGRLERSGGNQDSYFSPATSFFREMRDAVVRVLAPPHILVVYGHGWRDLLRQSIPVQVAAELRALDLLRTAVALVPGLSLRAGVDTILRACGVARVSIESDIDSEAYNDLLWAVVARAGRRGLTWPELLGVADAATERPPFERYAFDEKTIADLPHLPGVYIMHGADGAVLYVGKAADLARRVGDYFRTAMELPPKLAAIRDRIRELEYELVGSELEALLKEHQLITDRAPALNVQRHVSEAPGRYGAPLMPTVIILPSAREGRLDLFLFGGPGGEVIQMSIDPARPPRKALARALTHLAGDMHSLQKTARLKVWPGESHEICCRYFGRNQNRLQWLSVDGSVPLTAFCGKLLAIVSKLAARPVEPGEWRLGQDERP